MNPDDPYEDEYGDGPPEPGEVDPYAIHGDTHDEADFAEGLSEPVDLDAEVPLPAPFDDALDAGDSPGGYELADAVPTDPQAPLPPATSASYPQPAPYAGPPGTPGEIAATAIHCTNCGYNLTGITIGGACPECGMSVGDSLVMGAQQATSGMSVASMVLGILGVLTGCFPCVGAIMPITGLILGIVGLNQCAAGGYAGSSRGMAIAGIILNSVGLVIQLLFWVPAFL